MKNYGVIIHPEDFKDLLDMSADECGHIVQNMIKTFNGDSGVPFADRYLTRVSNDLCGRVLRDKELSERQSRNGKKGGASEGHPNYNQGENKSKLSESLPKVKPKLSQSLPKVDPKLNPNTNTNTNTNKNIYGVCQNVFLTDEEHKKVIDLGLGELIDELSLYISSKGAKYKNHYSTILAWDRRRQKEHKPTLVKPNQFTAGVERKEIDISELEKRLIKN